jgi:hypothetical protein
MNLTTLNSIVEKYYLVFLNPPTPVMASEILALAELAATAVNNASTTQKILLNFFIKTSFPKSAFAM